MTAPAGSGASPARDGDTRAVGIRPDVIEAWRLCLTHDPQPQLGQFNWPMVLGKVLDEVERLLARTVCEACGMNHELMRNGNWSDTVRKYEDRVAERDIARSALAEVAARHQPYPLDDRTLCRHCGREWPCADAVTAGETG